MTLQYLVGSATQMTASEMTKHALNALYHAHCRKLSHGLERCRLLLHEGRMDLHARLKASPSAAGLCHEHDICIVWVLIQTVKLDAV